MESRLRSNLHLLGATLEADWHTQATGNGCAVADKAIPPIRVGVIRHD